MDKEFHIDCNCGCGILKLTYFEDKNDDMVFLSYYADSFYEHQEGVFNTIWNRIKNAWMMLRGKDFFLYEVAVEKKQLEEFKKWVAGL